MNNNDQLAARWSHLVDAVGEEFGARRQDPNAVFSDDPDTRQLRARLYPNDQDGETFAVTVSMGVFAGFDEDLSGTSDKRTTRWIVGIVEGQSAGSNPKKDRSRVAVPSAMPSLIHRNPNHCQ